MRLRRCVIWSLIPLLLAGTVPQTLACGESLYRVGRGLAYRVYSAPLPANLIVYTRSESEAVFARHLAESGHTVHAVSSHEQLQNAVNVITGAVVIAPVAEVDALQASNTTREWTVQFLPVVDGGKDELGEARLRYGQVLSSGDDLKDFLRAIHRTLEAV